MNASIAAVRYIVTDLVATVDFYTEQLGVRLEGPPEPAFASLARGAPGGPGAMCRPDDVFWLTESELDELAEALERGRSALGDKTAVIDERRGRLDRERRHTPPPSLPRKVTLAGLDFSRWLPARAEQQAGNTIKGLGAGPGRATAAARVLRGPEDFGRMQHGDVLVAAVTTPAWTPLFALAAGVVTDVGGPLSHSSIVAREYGIPAVLGTGVATRRIQSGGVITVDGSTGVVTLPGHRLE